MTADTAAYHCPSELTLVDVEVRGHAAIFVAASNSTPGALHRARLDVLAGVASCDCPAGRRGRACWHVALVRAAWAGHPVRAAIAGQTDAELAETGRTARRHCAVYAGRGWAVPLTDRLALLACREEWRLRAVAAGDGGGAEAA